MGDSVIRNTVCVCVCICDGCEDDMIYLRDVKAVEITSFLHGMVDNAEEEVAVV